MEEGMLEAERYQQIAQADKVFFTATDAFDFSDDEEEEGDEQQQQQRQQQQQQQQLVDRMRLVQMFDVVVFAGKCCW